MEVREPTTNETATTPTNVAQIWKILVLLFLNFLLFTITQVEISKADSYTDDCPI